MPGPAEQLAERLDPDDGFRVVDASVGNVLSLHVTFYIEGKLVFMPYGDPEVSSIEFFRYEGDLTPAAYGEKARAKLLGEAICRYLNTGGDSTVMSSIVAVFRESNWITSMDLPGLELMASHANSDGRFEHLFVEQESSGVLRWVEGDFVDHTTLTEISNELEAEEHDAVIEHRGDLLALQRGEGAGAEEQDEGGPEVRLHEQGVRG